MLSASKIDKLEKAIKEFAGEHRFVFSQGQILATISATEYDDYLSDLLNKDEAGFCEEFTKRPPQFARIEERQGKMIIKTFLANSDEGKRLIAANKVLWPKQGIIIGIEKIPDEDIPKYIEECKKRGVIN